MSRQPLSDKLKQEVLERDKKCVSCRGKNDLEIAHVEGYEFSQSHDKSNLVTLCKICHLFFDERVVYKQRIKNAKHWWFPPVKHEWWVYPGDTTGVLDSVIFTKYRANIMKNILSYVNSINTEDELKFSVWTTRKQKPSYTYTQTYKRGRLIQNRNKDKDGWIYR
ncbi:MAG: HNH endonuclease [Candidatus Aenigmarchaeota archaeon]|nr:HNH endonuclease [Candidatus Aenigmarchaeota archaeon]